MKYLIPTKKEIAAFLIMYGILITVLGYGSGGFSIQHDGKPDYIATISFYFCSAIIIYISLCWSVHIWKNKVIKKTMKV